MIAAYEGRTRGSVNRFTLARRYFPADQAVFIQAHQVVRRPRRSPEWDGDNVALGLAVTVSVTPEAGPKLRVVPLSPALVRQGKVLAMGGLGGPLPHRLAQRPVFDRIAESCLRGGHGRPDSDIGDRRQGEVGHNWSLTPGAKLRSRPLGLSPLAWPSCKA